MYRKAVKTVGELCEVCVDYFSRWRMSLRGFCYAKRWNSYFCWSGIWFILDTHLISLGTKLNFLSELSLPRDTWDWTSFHSVMSVFSWLTNDCQRDRKSSLVLPMLLSEGHPSIQKSCLVCQWLKFSYFLIMRCSLYFQGLFQSFASFLQTTETPADLLDLVSLNYISDNPKVINSPMKSTCWGGGEIS